MPSVNAHNPPPPGRSRRQPPPPPGTANRRKHARYELLAQIEVDSRDGDVAILDVGNVSLGGVFALAEEGFTLAPGDRVQVYLDLEDVSVRSAAEVVRVTDAGFAMMWVSSDPEVAADLAALLEHVQTLAD